MQRMPYICDPKLIPRVQKYLEANVDKTYVDIGLMADELQNTYREYSRRKRNAFRTSVKKAYSIVLRSYGLDDQNDSSSEEEVEEAESENSKDERSNDNFANNRLVEMYSRNINVPKMNENELIDISSDDSKDETELLARPSNGPSTSVKIIRTNIPNNSTTHHQEDRDKCEKITVIQGKKRKNDDRVLIPLTKKKKTEHTDAIKSEVPNVTYQNVVGMRNILSGISYDILFWMKPLWSEEPSQLSYLLLGPPGCGKTLLAHVIAGQHNLPLTKVAATELVDGISGNSEKLIRELFKKAEASAPCVLFIDDIDAITSNSNGQKDMQKRIVLQLNNCLDEIKLSPNGHKVIIIAATSNPDSLNPSLRREGRFSQEIRLGLPNEESRIAIIKLYSSKLNLAADIDWNIVGAVTPGFVGGDLLGLVLRVQKRVARRFYDQHHDELMRIEKIPEKRNAIVETGNKDKCESDQNEIIVDDDPKEVDDDKINNSNDVLVIDDENSKQEEEGISSSTPPTEIKDLETSNPPKEIETDDSNIAESPLPVKNESCDKWLVEDISKLTTVLARRGVPDHLKQSFVVTTDDFVKAAEEMKPLSIREGMVCVPKVSWEDVGSLKDIRQELMLTVMGALKQRERYKRLGLDVPAGLLLCGPPGCGKTLVAKAVANEARLNFISVKGPELLNMYVGESEKAVRMCFERAKNSAPCIVFFDEIDALCPKRSSKGQNEVTSRVVAQLLTELDGVDERKDVFILAATNRPDVLDPAVLRPGRFDKILYVGLPSADDRAEILKTITRNGVPPLGPDVDLDSIGRSEELSGYTGADLASLMKEAARCLIASDLEGGDVVGGSHIAKAISKIRPSVTEKDREMYEEMKNLYTQSSQQNEKMDLS